MVLVQLEDIFDCTLMRIHFSDSLFVHIQKAHLPITFAVN